VLVLLHLCWPLLVLTDSLTLLLHLLMHARLCWGHWLLLVLLWLRQQHGEVGPWGVWQAGQLLLRLHLLLRCLVSPAHQHGL
jgi:hypothetical protein